MHSGVLRAEQSALLFSQSWGGICCEQVPGLGPNDDPSTWSAQLASMHDDIMLVGHLPYMQRLAGLLICGDAERQAIHFRNGGVVSLERRESGWSLLWQINPSLLHRND